MVKGIDLVLLFTVVGLIIFGLLMVYSSSFIYAHERSGNGYDLIERQFLFSLIGVVVMAIASRIDYRRWKTWAFPLWGVSLLLLFLVQIPGLGVRVGGAQRWLNLGLITVQPSEAVKFSLVLFVATLLHRKRERLRHLLAGTFSIYLYLLPCFILLLLQPDFGTTVIVAAVVVTLQFLAGVPLRFLASILGFFLTIGASLIFLSPYRLARFKTYMDPWLDPTGKGFQILQSLIGLHNGQLFGTGLGNGKQKLFYLPEAHNDFIFSVVGEELGLVGVAAVVIAFSVILLRGLRIGWKCYRDYGDLFGLLLATGITLLIGYQAFVNMAVVVGVFPTKGLNLPFISYGGSAMMINLFMVGILLSLSRGPKVFSR